MQDVDPAAVRRFWALIEEAWSPSGAVVNNARMSLATRAPDEDDSPVDSDVVDTALDAVLSRLRARFEALDQAELAAVDRVLERALYEIDREEIQAVTDGSDDGFLYCRGYIVALGQAFYDAVAATPELAIMDSECEELCYLPAHVYESRFGAFPEHGTGISRESCSNTAGWPDA